jgi:HTH-type transcriptional regulator, competence development regulator
MSETYNWEYLKSIREERSLTLRDVESATGISNAYLSQLESGKIGRPSVQYIYLLSKIYGIEAEEMLLAIGIVKPVDIQEKVTLLDRIKALEKKVSALESKLSLSFDKF